jgi:hypothetical protein
MTNKPALTELRKVLAELYPTVQDSWRVVEDVGLDPAYIIFSDKAINNWSNILEEAQNRNRAQAIIEVAHGEYPENKVLRYFSELIRGGERLPFPSALPERLQETGIRRSRQRARAGLWRTLVDWPVVTVLLVLFFGLSVWLMFIAPQKYAHAHFELGPAKAPIWLSLTYPRYIGGGDQGSVDVTICNEADRVISGTVIIDFSDDYIISMGSSRTNRIEFRNLVPRERQTSRVGFILREAPSYVWEQAPPVRFDVRVTDASGTTAAVLDQTIEIAPFPYLRTVLVSGGVLSGALGAVLVALLTVPADWLKKRLIPE